MFFKTQERGRLSVCACVCVCFLFSTKWLPFQHSLRIQLRLWTEIPLASSNLCRQCRFLRQSHLPCQVQIILWLPIRAQFHSIAPIMWLLWYPLFDKDLVKYSVRQFTHSYFDFIKIAFIFQKLSPLCVTLRYNNIPIKTKICQEMKHLKWNPLKGFELPVQLKEKLQESWH